MKARLLILVIMFMGIITSSHAQTVKGKYLDCKYILDENGLLTITGKGNFDLPVKIFSKVSDKGKAMRKKIKSVIIEEGVTVIGFGAFEDCYNLETVSLPKTLSIINSNAFDHCIRLESVNLPESLTIIGDNAFGGCSRLTFITIPNSVKEIGNYIFTGCRGLVSVTLPLNTISIKQGEFADCISLKYIHIPNGVKYIENCAFIGCRGLKAVTIPSSVRTIDYNAFNRCENLESIIIPNSVKYIDGNAFCELTNLKKIIVPDYEVPHNHSEILSEYPGIDLRKSRNLQSIKGNSIEICPAYMEKYLPREYVVSRSKSFRYYAETKISNELDSWAKKGEFETTEQWKQRVTETNQKKEAEKRIAQAKQDFIKTKAPSFTSVGTYDADQGALPITMSNGNTIYVNVPVSDAQTFKTQWDSVKKKPEYGIVSDTLTLLSCSFELSGKKYGTLQNYKEDSSQDLAINLPSLNLDLGVASDNSGNSQAAKPVVIDNTIDKNIPTTALTNANTFAVIIGNANYQRVAKVQYAANDAATFAAYCQKTLGLPQKNIRGYKDATYATMLAALKDIQDISKAYGENIDVIFYYAGHGVPDGKDQSAYLLPVDADGSQMDFCLSTKKLYQSLNSMGAKKVVVLMDACFSGAQRGEGMLASARGVALKVKDDVPTGNMVVFTAANGQQTAYPFKEKVHGMFTYFLLKKLHDTKGNVSLGDLTDYVSEQVAQQSVVVNKRSQTPTVIPAATLSGSWRNMKLQ